MGGDDPLHEVAAVVQTATSAPTCVFSPSEPMGLGRRARKEERRTIGDLFVEAQRLPYRLGRGIEQDGTSSLPRCRDSVKTSGQWRRSTRGEDGVTCLRLGMPASFDHGVLDPPCKSVAIVGEFNANVRPAEILASTLGSGVARGPGTHLLRRTRPGAPKLKEERAPETQLTQSSGRALALANTTAWKRYHVRRCSALTSRQCALFRRARAGEPGGRCPAPPARRPHSR